MKKFPYWVFILVLAGVHLLPSKLAAAQLKKLRLAFSALAYANPPFWIAHELKLFEKYGLETELVYLSGSRPLAEKQPALKAKNPTDFVDSRVVQKLDDEGFFRKFSSK